MKVDTMLCPSCTQKLLIADHSEDCLFISHGWTNTSPIISRCFNKIKQKGLISVLSNGAVVMGEQRIKQDEIQIGKNIREIRIQKGIGQTALVGQLQLHGIAMTRETLVKIERGVQHIQASQLKAIRDALETSYDELLK
jgi:DNA-binding Xre family transcriptional regulator